jgi:AcrR family transcriptional regulator
MTKTTTSDTSAEPTPRTRLQGGERERIIAQEAVKFFAEVGFDGDTRELARRLGVTQSLIYRYFPTKAALIDRVYQEVYVGRWNPYWESIIADRSMPLESRLIRLYTDYARTALTWDWVRIFMFSGLRNEDINKRYLQFLRSRILEPVATELRATLGLPPPSELALTTAEVELVWGINARVFYWGQRHWIFDVPMEEDLDSMIHLTIRHFMKGAQDVVPDLLKATAETRSAGKNSEPLLATPKTSK